MKKTLFITMLAAALMGSQVLAEEFTPTTVSNASLYYGIMYVGEYSLTDDVSGGNVTIQKDLDLGDDLSGCVVYGGRADAENKIATNNAVTMSGGQVDYVYGGACLAGTATLNTITISGGQVDTVYGGSGGTIAENNTVTISGGQVDNIVFGGYGSTGNAENNTVIVRSGTIGSAAAGSSGGGEANDNTLIMTGGSADSIMAGTGKTKAEDNHVYLVGKGGEVTINGLVYTCEGDAPQIQYNVSAGTVPSGEMQSGTTIEIYGTDIGAGSMGSTEEINFHLSDYSLLSPETAMVNTGAYFYCTPDYAAIAGLWRTGIYGDDVTDWSAFDGQCITLVNAPNGATIMDVYKDLQEVPVDITDKDGNVLAQAKVKLSEDGTTLYLDFTNDDDFSVGYQVANTLWASAGIVADMAGLAEERLAAPMQEGATQVWAGGLGFFQRETQELRGYTYNGGGYAVGVQHAFSQSFAAGLSFGQSFGHFKAKDDSLTARERGIMPALTARYRCQGNKVAHILSGHVAYGDLRYTGDLRGESPSRMRWTDHALSAGLTAGAETKVAENTTLTPFVGLTYVTASQSSAHNGAVRYHDGKMHNLSIPVGVTLRHCMGSFTPEVSLAYRGDVARMDPRVRTATAEGETREIGARPGRNALEVNAGASYAISDSVGAYASYTFTCRSKANSHSVNAGLQMTF